MLCIWKKSIMKVQSLVADLRKVFGTWDVICLKVEIMEDISYFKIIKWKPTCLNLKYWCVYLYIYDCNY